jgi:hypothetical protein
MKVAGGIAVLLALAFAWAHGREWQRRRDVDTLNRPWGPE